MRICMLGLGVIGTTYAYAFQKAGHSVEHILRDEKRSTAPTDLQVYILDGRYNPKGEEVEDTYSVKQAQADTNYDFIFLSVRHGHLESGVEALRKNGVKGTLVFFCNFWDDRDFIEKIAGDYPYIIAFPTAGGSMEERRLNGVLFDHVMLESHQKTKIQNYDDLLKLFQSADIKLEISHDMVEWIWIHMAINAGVTSTAASLGDLSQPQLLAEELMDSSNHLTRAVKVIRETLAIVEKRGVDLKKYRGELLPYKVPAWLAGKLMRRLFATNVLTRRIMTAHTDQRDILYGCQAVYQTGKDYQLKMLNFERNMQNIL